MRILLPFFTCAVLILAYVVSVHFLYGKRFEENLTAHAESLISGKAGLEDVRVEFQAFDATLSGNVASSRLRDEAARLITSLPAARVVSNRISYPGFVPRHADPPRFGGPSGTITVLPAEVIADTPPGRAAAPPADTAPAPASPAPAPKPAIAPKPPPHLAVSASAESVALSGAVPDVTVRAAFLTAIARSGRYAAPKTAGLRIDPGLAAADWPAKLPAFVSLLLTRADDATLTIDGDRFEVRATAIDPVARDQVRRRFESLDTPGRERNLEVSLAEGPEIAEDAFFFKAVVIDGNLSVRGRLASDIAKSRLTEICRADLPDLEIDEKIDVTDDIVPPRWAARLPHVLSLVCTSTVGARITADTGTLRVIAEMDRGKNADDLADRLSLMAGPDVELVTRLLDWEQNFPDGKPE